MKINEEALLAAKAAYIRAAGLPVAPREWIAIHQLRAAIEAYLRTARLQTE